MTIGFMDRVQVQDVMTHHVMRVGPLTSIGEALNLMYEGHISALPVVDDGDHCFGIVTASDLVDLLRATEQALRSDYPDGENASAALKMVRQRLELDPVRDVMSELMVTVSPDVTLERAAKTMADENVHHLPVVADRQLIGFLSSADIVRALASESAGNVESVRAIESVSSTDSLGVAESGEVNGSSEASESAGQ